MALSLHLLLPISLPSPPPFTIQNPKTKIINTTTLTAVSLHFRSSQSQPLLRLPPRLQPLPLFSIPSPSHPRPPPPRLLLLSPLTVADPRNPAVLGLISSPIPSSAKSKFVSNSVEQPLASRRRTTPASHRRVPPLLILSRRLLPIPSPDFIFSSAESASISF